MTTYNDYMELVYTGTFISIPMHCIIYPNSSVFSIIHYLVVYKEITRTSTIY